MEMTTGLITYNLLLLKYIKLQNEAILYFKQFISKLTYCKHHDSHPNVDASSQPRH
jgi:hypothetical protein